jgi:hypothetical protein
VQAGWLEAGSHATLWSGQLREGTIEAGTYSVWVTLSTDIGTVTQKASITVTA